MSADHQQKVWFITGAASGLGNALTKAVLQQGDKVVATARNAQERLKLLTEKYPDQFVAAELDITDKNQIAEALKKALNAFERIDVLVNNAGITHAAALEDMSEDDIRKMVEVNLFGALNVTRAFLPVLRKQKSGHILNVTSLAGRSSYMGNAMYGATKFAVEGMSESLVQELKPFEIKLTIIEPATYKTELVSGMIRHKATDTYQHVYDFLKQGEAAGGSENTEGYAKAVIEVTEVENPPLRLTVGSGGAKILYNKIKGELEEREKWQHLSDYTDAT